MSQFEMNLPDGQEPFTRCPWVDVRGGGYEEISIFNGRHWLDASQSDRKLMTAAGNFLNDAGHVYLALCRIPRASVARIGTDPSRAKMRDFIAAATGRTAEEVQNYYEGLAAQ